MGASTGSTAGPMPARALVVARTPRRAIVVGVASVDALDARVAISAHARRSILDGRRRVRDAARPLTRTTDAVVRHPHETRASSARRNARARARIDGRVLFERYRALVASSRGRARAREVEGAFALEEVTGGEIARSRRRETREGEGVARNGARTTSWKGARPFAIRRSRSCEMRSRRTTRGIGTFKLYL